MRHCPECGRAFARTDVLAAHLRKHEEEARRADPNGLASHGHHGVHGIVRGPGEHGEGADPVAGVIADDFLATVPPKDDLDAMYDWLVHSFVGEAPPGELDTSAAGPSEPHDISLPTPTAVLSTFAPTFNCEVDESTRSALISYLCTIPSFASSPFSACSTLSAALFRYWTVFHPQLPILHAPTFDPAASTALLATLVAVGFCCDSDDALYDFGASIFRKLSATMQLHDLHEPPVSLETFQALVIHGQASQMLLNSTQHQLSYISSAYEYGLSRGMDIFYVRFYKRFTFDPHASEEEQWRTWITSESWRRAAHRVMEREIEQALLFNQLSSRALTMLVCRLPLPVGDDVWNAPTAAAWKAQPPLLSVPYCSAIKGVLTSSPGSHDRLNSFALSSILHGLMSVGWDLKWRGTLRADAIMPLQTEINWHAALHMAHERVERDLAAALELPFLTESERLLSWTSKDLLLIAQLDLLVDLHSMLTFAGVMRIGGRYVGPDDYALAAKTIRKWCTTDVAVEAAKLVTEYLSNRVTIADLDTGWSASKGMYAPWSIYFASVPFPLLSAMPTAWDPADLPSFLQSTSRLLKRQRWAVGKDAGEILASLMDRRVATE
ncbi:hypothetical protein Rhopal_000024-T1 [Rhodotorula paludigena]|uniref:C2H2-type domain-containing protein n=1 Tax=Rhodotorula paludigena TaxID=86838 RepID=A0AAV5GCJ6_9BASI|nr:hypothetical protein Rhopal_000024-T1 [Rhodotorula paludigena]